MRWRSGFSGALLSVYEMEAYSRLVLFTAYPLVPESLSSKSKPQKTKARSVQAGSKSRKRTNVIPRPPGGIRRYSQEDFFKEFKVSHEDYKDMMKRRRDIYDEFNLGAEPDLMTSTPSKNYSNAINLVCL